MTIPGLWDKLSEYGTADERLPLRVYAKEFYLNHDRNLRIGIDGYMWLFELSQPAEGGSSIFSNNEAAVKKLVLNLSARIRELIKLNISFVFVFDGGHKIYKKRWEKNTTNLLDKADEDFQVKYNEVNRQLKKFNSRFSGFENIPGMKDVRQLLDDWNITYVNAAGEAEAELARLNDCGVIDAVLSNDGDSFMFGAKTVLKNFSKWLSDKPSSQSIFDKEKQETESYITPYRMDKIESLTGLTRERMIFIACLNGSDYSDGVAGLGITRCIRLAQIGTQAYNHEYLVDYADELTKIYCSKSPIDRIRGVVPFTKVQREERLLKLRESLVSDIEANSKQLFGRQYKGKIEFPTDYYFMCHYYPFLAPVLYRFLPYDSNCADIDPQEELTISLLPQPASVEYSSDQSILLLRGNNKGRLGNTSVVNLKIINSTLEAPQESQKTPMAWFEKPSFKKMCLYIFPISRSVRSFLLDHLSEAYVLRAIYNLPSFTGKDMVHISGYREISLPTRRRTDDLYVPKWKEEQYQVKYNKNGIFGKYLTELQDDELYDENYHPISPEKDKFQSVWIPKHLIVGSEHGDKLIKQFDEGQLLKSQSPKKKASPRKISRQSATLDSLFNSPTRMKGKTSGLRRAKASPSKVKGNSCTIKEANGDKPGDDPLHINVFSDPPLLVPDNSPGLLFVPQKSTTTNSSDTKKVSIHSQNDTCVSTNGKAVKSPKKPATGRKSVFGTETTPKKQVTLDTLMSSSKARIQSAILPEPQESPAKVATEDPETIGLIDDSNLSFQDSSVILIGVQPIDHEVISLTSSRSADKNVSRILFTTDSENDSDIEIIAGNPDTDNATRNTSTRQELKKSKKKKIKKSIDSLCVGTITSSESDSDGGQTGGHESHPFEEFFKF